MLMKQIYLLGSGKKLQKMTKEYICIINILKEISHIPDCKMVEFSIK